MKETDVRVLDIESALARQRLLLDESVSEIRRELRAIQALLEDVARELKALRGRVADLEHAQALDC